MHDVALQTLPTGDELWTIEEFLEKNEESCRLVVNIFFQIPISRHIYINIE